MMKNADDRAFWMSAEDEIIELIDSSFEPKPCTDEISLTMVIRLRTKKKQPSLSAIITKKKRDCLIL